LHNKEFFLMALRLVWLQLTLALACALTLSASCLAQTQASTATANVRILPALAMPGLDRQRTVRVYLPPSYAGASVKRYPVLYMHDGQNLFDKATSYAGEWEVDESLNALAQKEGLELIVVGIDNGQDKRINELTAWSNPRFGKAQGETYMDFIVKTVKPLIDQQFRTQSDRAHTAIMGSSLGGLISHYAILQYRETFSKAGIFSPSYWVAEGAYDMVKTRPLPANTRLFLLAGGREGTETTANMERMVALLGSVNGTRVDLTSRVNPQGEHNEAFWRAEFPAAVRWLFRP
jgi:alpha-glucosidase